jgi:hypothetical protein
MYYTLLLCNYSWKKTWFDPKRYIMKNVRFVHMMCSIVDDYLTFLLDYDIVKLSLIIFD